MAIAPGIMSTERSRGDIPANGRAMGIVSTLFFMWGFLTCLNDILIPRLKGIFSLNYSEAMLVQMCFFSAYFLFSVPSGKVVEWIGYRRTMVLGLVVMATGALIFLPAAAMPSFSWFLAALIVLATGMTLLQVSANPYVAALGPQQTASSRLNLAQAFNSLGTTVAPYFGSVLILHAVDRAVAARATLSQANLQSFRLEQAATVKLPYLGIALTLLALAVVLLCSHLPPVGEAAEVSNASALASAIRKDSLWHHPKLIFGAAGIFLYVGAEIAIGSFLVSYFSQPETGGLTQQRAAMLVSLYWGGTMVGRFIGARLLQSIRTGIALALAAAAACLLVLASMFSFGLVAVVTILLVGLFNSIMFPNIFTLGIEGLGPLTGRGSGILISAIFGGAIIPYLEGRLADRIGVQHAFVIPAACYALVAIYGLWASRTEPARRVMAT